ncbi:hypothetical protein DPMN_160168 [Dreissena polymorpha]|uniref:Uncharacterized protein n=1 Tax=Dreissena polymorpha TaxID=45954 RepID=A0A9D4IPV4_DREPO|nr:hypothetical protein DPMN_160168 [Dreissena polymorpha]
MILSIQPQGVENLSVKCSTADFRSTSICPLLSTCKEHLYNNSTDSKQVKWLFSSSW